jgi:ribonuclease Z
MGYGGASPGFAMNGDMFQPQIKRDEAPLDFNSTPSRNLSEMDLEADGNMNTVAGYFVSPNANKNQFVDPNALGGQEVVPMGSSTQVGRMYPGMHQQAAMAKAAQQQRQHDMLRQQQQQQEQLQQQRNNATPQAQQPQASNAVVEERISRLLQQMKSASGSPSESPSPSAGGHLSKSKKDEQDMDEDERLLASEEGKKLSSKERRQLRNKVSARAFRSRRKGTPPKPPRHHNAKLMVYTNIII